MSIKKKGQPFNIKEMQVTKVKTSKPNTKGVVTKQVSKSVTKNVAKVDRPILRVTEVSRAKFVSGYSPPKHQYGSSILFLTNPENELAKMELTFRSMKVDGDGNPLPSGDPLMNEYGINSIIGTVPKSITNIRQNKNNMNKIKSTLKQNYNYIFKPNQYIFKPNQKQSIGPRNIIDIKPNQRSSIRPKIIQITIPKSRTSVSQKPEPIIELEQPMRNKLPAFGFGMPKRPTGKLFKISTPKNSYKKTKKNKGFFVNFKPKYVSSIEANVFNFKGSKPSKMAIKTGFIMRAMVR